MRVLWGFLAVFWAAEVTAETLKIATFNVDMSRRGAGLLVQELERNPGLQARKNAAIIQTVAPDVLLLNDFDFDPEGRAIAAFQALLRVGQYDAEPIFYPYSYASPPNSGRLTGYDLNGNGQATDARDAQGYGRFPGQGGMVVLSRYPVDPEASRSFTELLWRDFPGSIPPQDHPGYIAEVQRLSSKAHWDVVVRLKGHALHVLASHPTPPVFDGPEDMNGRRNHDEIALWSRYLSGASFIDHRGQAGTVPADDLVVVLGTLNADPQDGDGRREAISALLKSSRLQDPLPASAGGGVAADIQAGVNIAHRGAASLDTADWGDTGPGNLRVDYVLPDARFRVLQSGVFWPAPGAAGYEFLTLKDGQTSDHRLVWVEVAIPGRAMLNSSD